MRARVVVATDGLQRQVDAWLAEHPAGARMIIVEGAFAAFNVPDDVPVTRLAAGCICCLGQLPLRVTLVRSVRALRPEYALLLLANGAHLDRVRALLAEGSLGVRFELD